MKLKKIHLNILIGLVLALGGALFLKGLFNSAQMMSGWLQSGVMEQEVQKETTPTDKPANSQQTLKKELVNYTYFLNSKDEKTHSAVKTAKDIISCMEEGACTSEKSKFRKSVAELSQELKDLAEKQSSYIQFAELFGSYLIQVPEPSLQSSALKLLKSLPKSEKIRDSIVAGVSFTLSPALMNESLEVLKQYQQREDQKVVKNFLMENIENGTFTTSAVAARKSVHFMNEDNYEEFKNVLSKLDVGSKTHTSLKISMRDYYLRNGI